MSGTISGDTGATTSFSSGDAAIPAAVGGGGTAGPSVGAGSATGPVVSVNTAGLELPGLPAQYSTAGGLGFFTRQMEVAPTSVTVGPDGALYIGELSGLPYPEGYARILRVANPEETTGFDGRIPSGVVETYASGFSQINGLSFDGGGNLYVLEYVNGSNIYNPLLTPGELPPSQLIRVAPDGTRTAISGPELKLGNYVLADKETGDVYVAINNADIENGQVLRYRVDPATGQATSVEVVADGLNNPRGMAFGPDGELYVNEQGLGTPGDSPEAATAPTVPFIPGLVNERGGFTASITRVDTDGSGDGERIFTGIPSIREYDPNTGQDRVISVGSNGFTIAPDGTAYVAAGGGLSQATAGALGEFGNSVKGLLRIEGLFDGDPSDATITPTFDSVAYAAQYGPDGSTTLFNNQSNLNDVAVGTDGKLYTVDAARNVLYGFEENGDQTTPDSATVTQKRPPVLTPPQYAAVVAAGGDPTADYNVEIAERTSKNGSGAPDTPGRAAAAVVTAGATTEALASAAGAGTGTGTAATTTGTGAGTTPIGTAPTGTGAGTTPIGTAPTGTGAGTTPIGTAPTGTGAGTTPDRHDADRHGRRHHPDRHGHDRHRHRHRHRRARRGRRRHVARRGRVGRGRQHRGRVRTPRGHTAARPGVPRPDRSDQPADLRRQHLHALFRPVLRRQLRPVGRIADAARERGRRVVHRVAALQLRRPAVRRRRRVRRGVGGAGGRTAGA
jgi:hypothetical protein